MQYIIVIALAYLIGCSNMAKYIAFFKKVDLSAGGSGNPGASNAVILMGWGAGVLTALHDIGKSALAVVLARLVFPDVPHIGAVAGVASVLGHIYPFWMKFKGGKGFASYLGMTIALNWKISIVVLLLVGIVTLVTDYIVAATTNTIIIVPAWLGIAGHSWILALILLVASAVIAWKHRENYVRMYKGTEIRFRKAGRGDYRVDK
jgi:glycerol-3-phosphate acyltransferase PlsY